MKHIKFWLKLLLSGGLLSFLFYTINIEDTFNVIINSNRFYLVVAFLIAIGDRILMAYKWNILLKAKAIQIPLVNITGTYLITTFFGLFLPPTIGADALRAYAVGKDGHKASDIISSIIVERVLGFVALFVMALVGIALSISVFDQIFFATIQNLFWLILILLLILSGMVVISLNRHFLHWVEFLFEALNINIGKFKLITRLKEVYQSYRNYENSIAYLSIFLVLSFVENLFPLLWTYFLSLAFNIEIPFFYLFILTPIVLILVRMPISVDGIGVQEVAFVYLLALIGVVKSEALLLGIASHIIAIISVLPGGILYIFSGLSFGCEMIPGRREPQQHQ